MIDARETTLEASLRNSDIEFTKDTLALGDAVIVNDPGETLLIFERKTWQDLASSISDGRYVEQSTRLLAAGVSNHNVVYVIEGDLEKYKQRGRVSAHALRSAIVSLNYYKGFSVMLTSCTAATAQLLGDYLRKISKEAAAGKTPTLQQVSSEQLEPYVQLQQRGKRKTRPEEIETAMVAQIPGINATMASNILSISSLRQLIETKGSIIENATYTTTTGKTRRIPCSVAESLKEYLANV